MSKLIYKALNQIQSEISSVGISKNNRNKQQGFQFRGIDDVYNALSPLMAKHGVCVFPTVLERNVVEKATRNGGTLFYVTVKVQYDVVCVEDGSERTVIMYGEAMDSGDKGTNKALSIAYKMLMFQMFAIPTQGDNDADSTTHYPVNDNYHQQQQAVQQQQYNRLPSPTNNQQCNQPQRQSNPPQQDKGEAVTVQTLSLIHISEPTRPY